jgi:hypothetical protein
MGLFHCSKVTILMINVLFPASCILFQNIGQMIQHSREEPCPRSSTGCALRHAVRKVEIVW